MDYDDNEYSKQNTLSVASIGLIKRAHSGSHQEIDVEIFRYNYILQCNIYGQVRYLSSFTDSLRI